MMKTTAMENALSRMAERIRTVLMAAASNESLFFAAAFLTLGILPTDLLLWHQEAVNMMLRYVVVPWGMALCLLRLERRRRMTIAPKRADLSVLFLLTLWVTVPFGIRFGLTFNNVSNWHGHIVVFFGIYAMLTEENAERREQLLDQACALMGVITLVLCGALLYCAALGITIDPDFVVYCGNYTGEGYGFGVYKSAALCSGFNPNITALLVLCCAGFCLAGFCRSRQVIVRALYGIAFVMALIVIVLTRSRTARYAMILGMAVGLYGYLAANLKMSRAVARHAVGVLAGAVLAVLAFNGASMLLDAALAHYAKLHHTDPAKAKLAWDMTMSGRTVIWGGLFRIWRENPKDLIIGHGVGRIGSQLLKGTSMEKMGSIAVHNTYLQHMADFGLIGFGVLCVFFAVILPPILRVFYARGERQKPGYRALCVLVIACLLTGLMESSALGAMTPMNMALFFALALLTARGKEIRN